MPKLSILVPFSNHQHTLEECIKSCLNQTFEDFELILIENLSLDNSYEIASTYAPLDSRIKLLSESRSGFAHALNAGLENAKGEYIARLDADDTNLPTRFEMQCNYLDENDEVDVISSCARHVTNTENEQKRLSHIIWSNKIITPEEIINNRFVDSPIIHSSACYRKSLIEQFGNYSQGYFPEDYEFWLRLLDNKVVFHKLTDYLVEWYDYPQRIERLDDKYNLQGFFEVKSMYINNFLTEKNDWYPLVAVWGAGRVARRWFSYLHELEVWPKFFIDLNANETKNVIQFKHTPPAGNNFILSYVANPAARQNIKEFLTDLGYTEGENFICVA